MAITLFPHNQTAYSSLLAMLDETGKACVVHPTGTGKSFIAFKYCEDHPEQRILWLSPSEYIFKTQRENLVATGAEAPQNIQFCTYAKLSIMDGDEIAELRPDAIIEDEFHRCGAHMWQQGVERLWRQYPNALRIGLSATSVRYLDSQRDMKAEFYDNCVASEMTLGDAIVRGILNEKPRPSRQKQGSPGKRGKVSGSAAPGAGERRRSGCDFRQAHEGPARKISGLYVQP